MTRNELVKMSKFMFDKSLKSSRTQNLNLSLYLHNDLATVNGQWTSVHGNLLHTFHILEALWLNLKSEKRKDESGC